MNRIRELADQPEGFKSAGAIPYKSLVPLQEIIADVLEVLVANSRVKAEYGKLVKAFGSEFTVLLGPSAEEMEKVTEAAIARGIVDAREGRVKLIAGYDGVFGHVKIPKSRKTALTSVRFDNSRNREKLF